MCHRAWLAAHPEHEQWCLEKLRTLQIEAPAQFDTPHSILDTSTEAFLGEAAVALIGESDAPWIRELAARGVMAFYYTSTRSVMRQAFRQRAVLKDDFGRIVNLMISWSGVRWAANHTQHMNQAADPAVERATNRLPAPSSRNGSPYVSFRFPESPKSHNGSRNGSTPVTRLRGVRNTIVAKETTNRKGRSIAIGIGWTRRFYPAGLDSLAHSPRLQMVSIANGYSIIVRPS